MELKDRVIAVTGASGMLGAYICRALFEAGARVRGVVRNPKKAAFLAQYGVEFAEATLEDRNALCEAFRGCDAVVSNAALYNVTDVRWQANYVANKQGTENVYEAIGDAGVRRAIQISTFGVYRWFPKPDVIREDSPVIDGQRREGGAYRATKQLSEALAFEISKKRGIATTALRPAGIYGARDKNLAPWIERLLRLPVAPAPRLHFPFVYAGDVASAVVGALHNDASVDKAYLVAGRDGTVEDFFRAWKSVTGARTSFFPLPLGRGLRVDTSLAQRDIGFDNVPYELGIQKMLEDARTFA
jgi:dihydroflavonol-4-reductase